MHVTTPVRLFCALYPTTIAIASMKASCRRRPAHQPRRDLPARHWASTYIATTASSWWGNGDTHSSGYADLPGRNRTDSPRQRHPQGWSVLGVIAARRRSSVGLALRAHGCRRRLRRRLLRLGAQELAHLG